MFIWLHDSASKLMEGDSPRREEDSCVREPTKDNKQGAKLLCFFW